MFDFSKNAACDIETLGFSSTILGYTIYNDDIQVALEWSDESAEYLQAQINAGIIMAFHNAKYDIPVLRDNGIEITRYHDTMILAYCENPSHESYGLDAVAKRYAGLSKSEAPKVFEVWNAEMAYYCLNDGKITWETFKKLIQKLWQDKRAARLYTDIERPYIEVIMEMESTGALIDVSRLTTAIPEIEADTEKLLRELLDFAGFVPGKEKVYSKKVTQNGDISWMPRVYRVPIGTPVPEGGVITKENRSTFDYSINEWQFVNSTTEVGYHKSGDTITYDHCEILEFNPNSTAHIIHVLQTKHDWEPEAFTESGLPSTADDVLSELEYPFAKLLTTYREAYKTLSSFLYKIDASLDEYNILRAEFKQTGTKSGRLSSSSNGDTGLNLQNIPAHTKYGELVRGLFVAPPGWSFCSADLSNIEGRMLAHYLSAVCRDDAMARIFIDGQDFHTLNAFNWGIVEFLNPGQGAKLLDLYLKGEVSKSDERIAFARQIAKTVLFALAYGAGAAKIAKTLKCSTEFAQTIIDKLKAAAPALFELKEKVWRSIESNDGVIHTLYGRRLVYANMVPEYCEENARALKQLDKWKDKPMKYLMKMLRSMDERSSFNGLLQGSAADVMKRWALNSTPLIHAAGGAIYFHVHDEQDFVIPGEEGAKELVDRVCNEAAKLSTVHCPIAAEGTFKFEGSWQDVH